MGLIGEELKKAREQKGLSLRDVEATTKIRIKYLSALEREEFDILPGRVYVIGFLRTYAKFLGLNDEEIVNQFKESQGDVNHEELDSPHVEPPKRSRRWIYLVLMFCIGAVIVLCLYYAVGVNKNNSDLPDQKGSEIQTPTDYPEEEANPLQDNETAPEANDAAEGIKIVINIKEQSCWLSVTVDGNKAFEGTLNAGESHAFQGNNSITVVYGNPGAAEVTVNGQTIYPVGEMGKRVVREYTKQLE